MGEVAAMVALLLGTQKLSQPTWEYNVLLMPIECGSVLENNQINLYPDWQWTQVTRTLNLCLYAHQIGYNRKHISFF